MSVTTSTGSAAGRPKAMQMSFSRYEPRPPSPLTRSRASTIQGPPQLHTPDVGRPATAVLTDDQRKDVFDKRLSLEELDSVASPDLELPPSRSFSLPDRVEELPVELASLTDR